MSRTAAPVDKHHKPLFPAPPTQSAEVKLFFDREASIRAQRRKGTAVDSFQTHGGFGDPANSVEPTFEEEEWIPDPERKDYGVWKRSVRFETTVTLPFAPTFSTETIKCKVRIFLMPGFNGTNEIAVFPQLHCIFPRNRNRKRHRTACPCESGSGTRLPFFCFELRGCPSRRTAPAA